MDHASSTEQRVIELEVKASWAEDMLDQLNQTIFRQQQQIEWLASELASMRDQIPETGNLPRNLRDEIPPHY